MTDQDIRDQVRAAISAGAPEHAEGIDVDAVVSEIISTYGLVHIDNIDDDAFWELIKRHDSTQAAPTMVEIYPAGSLMYHKAHEDYLLAVSEAFSAAGFDVDDWSAEANDPRDGYVSLNVATNREESPDNPIWTNAEVFASWSEDRGWSLVTVEESHRNSGRYVYDLDVARVAAPATVAIAAAEKIGDVPADVTDNHPDVDFPEHTFEVDDVPFELALRHYQA